MVQSKSGGQEKKECKRDISPVNADLQGRLMVKVPSSWHGPLITE
jgi:hypothetical protein